MIYPHFDHGKPPAAVRSRMLENGNGLNMHVLEAGFAGENRPCVLLLHGFPELACIISDVPCCFIAGKRDWGGGQ
jgi:hypothetical protein